MNNEPTLECVACPEPESIVSRIIRGVKYQLTELAYRLNLKKRPKSTYTLRAERELKIIGYEPIDELPENDPNRWVQENVFELLEVFSNQGHSGFSAPCVIDLFSKLAKFEILSPLTGEDSEWTCVSDGVFQNNRCSHVFKQPDRFDGQAYDINGKIFREPDGGCYTSSDSFVPITFPYIPKSEYVDVPSTETT